MVSAVVLSPAVPGRDLRVDFLRGLALVFIFWDHIPDNVLGLFTLRNLGFSDAAEFFVFLSGYGAALAYGGVYRRAGYFPAALRILRRTWVLYVAHVFLLAQLMGVVFITNAQVETRDFVQEMGLTYFVQNPERALVDGLLLRFKPGLMDPLPLYIVLLLALAAALPALRSRPLWLLSGSALLYWIAPRLGLNLHAQPAGVWFFNPLAWQFLFFLGAACALHRDTLRQWWQLRISQVAQRRIMASLSLLLALALLVVLSWNFPLVHDRWMPQALAELLYPIDKTNLGPARLLHFLALLAWLTVLFPAGAWLRGRLARALCRLGRHSLEVFCLGVLLAPMADAINTLAGDGWLVQCFTSLAGFGLFVLLAIGLDAARQDGNRVGSTGATGPAQSGVASRDGARLRSETE
jgi:hypothetical protein